MKRGAIPTPTTDTVPVAALKVVYLYVGTDDVDADLRFLVDGLGGELAWRFQEFGADVAGVRLGDGPMYIVADHRPAGSVLPIIAVDDLESSAEGLRAAGFTDTGTTVEVRTMKPPSSPGISSVTSTFSCTGALKLSA